MAIATSPLHRGFRGATGDFLFRNYNGKTVVSLRPVYRNETNTAARRRVRDHFRDATFYAHNALERIKERSYYEQKAKQLKLPNAYTAAITDYLRKAKARAITRSSFAARKGDVIYIRISKSVFRINRLIVQARDEKGVTLAEQMLCRMNERNLFRLSLADDLPGFASLAITTDEPGENITYRINVDEIYREKYESYRFPWLMNIGDSNPGGWR
jgi:hypothetical protein